MADWILIACLKQLFKEFDLIGPKRDHASDGSIGDTAHQHEVSDHNPDETGSVPIHDADHINEVHAIDVDNSGPWRDGLTMEKVVQFLLARCKSGKETRLRYIIYNRRIWDYRSNWVEKPYTGASAHTEHAHFSASYDSAQEASTASWHLQDLLEEDMPLSDEDATLVANKVWAIGNTAALRGGPATWGGSLQAVATDSANARGVPAALAALAGELDPAALAALLAAPLAAALAPLVGNVDVTTEELQEAIVAALRELAAPASDQPST